ncbi:hypothetical protein DSO57_1019914 [Entomophthora muscae]|nr:hypothetical protein DSO57_1019914 [Entomophthora muscae]
MTQGKSIPIACDLKHSPEPSVHPQKISMNALTSWVIIKPREKINPCPESSMIEILDRGSLASPRKKGKAENGEPMPKLPHVTGTLPMDLGYMAKDLAIDKAHKLGLPPKRFQANKKAASLSSSSLDNVLQPDEYEVEILLAKKGSGIFLSYLVKWKGYDIAESSWEPAKNLSCRELVVAFEECIRGLPEEHPGEYDPAIKDIISNVPKKALPNLKWLPKNISDFLLLVNKDIGPSISVVNTVDADGPPEDFVYIAKSVRGEGVPPIDPAFITGCDCKESCHTSKNSGCLCVDPDFPKIPYDKDGLLQLPPKHAIKECSINCKCSLTCRNRVIQRGRTVKLQIFKTANKGWGVRAMEKIPKGRFVAEYVGEIITAEEAERRGLEYDNRGLTYLFDLDFNYGPEEDCPYSIDAYKYGNVTHFINHSCDPNIAVYTALYESSDYDIHNLAFFAIKDIGKYEELCFDYAGGFDDSESTVGITNTTERISQVTISEKKLKVSMPLWSRQLSQVCPYLLIIMPL